MEVGSQIHELIESLYPICRSITGDGVRRTLARLREHVPLAVHEVPSGTAVFDWTVPREWNISGAHVETPDGERLVDFDAHSLHVVGYSVPVDRVVGHEELMRHVHTLPGHPDWIPYRTSYYSENWGFCVRHRELERFCRDEYRVRIDSTLGPGSLSYGELFLPGRTDEEFLIFSHVCHPSLCNDNLSGVALTAFAAKALGERTNRYGYRFVWAPGTIGSIAWLSLNRDRVRRIRHGLVAVLLGDPGPFHYKRSRRGDADIDRIVADAIGERGGRVLPFEPYGYDERQFCSPAFDLPVGRLTRSPNGAYPEYHTSADDLGLVSADALRESYDLLLEIVDAAEQDRRYVNLSPHCEPQLGRRGLYRSGGGTSLPERELAMLWVLNLSDGGHSLLDIAERSKLPLRALHGASQALLEARLLAPADGDPP